MNYHTSKKGRHYLLPQELDSYDRKAVREGRKTLIFALASVYHLVPEHFIRKLVFKVMECRVSLYKRYDSGEKITVHLVKSGNVRMLQTILLFTKHNDLDEHDRSLLHYTNTTDMTSYLLSKDLSVTKTDKEGNTPLFYCTDKNSILLMTRKMSDYDLCNIFITIVWKRQLDFAVRLVRYGVLTKSSYIEKCPDNTTKRYLLQESSE